MKVMIVEDDAIIAMLLQTEVERQGFTSLGPVATAAAAVQLAAEGKPDIVLMDIRLQGDVDGITAAALISANQNVDIIFITAFSDPTSLSRIEPLEPAGYLLKPFTARNLFVTLSVCASNRHIRLERDRLTRAIDQLQLLHSSVMENSPDGIICVDDKGEIVAANDAASRMFALPMDTLVGSPLNRLVPVDKAAGHPALFDSFLEGGGAQHHQMADRETLRGRRGDSTFPASIAL